MSKNIIWSSAAENDILKILEYLDLQRYPEIAISFVDTLDNQVLRVAENPGQFPYFDESKNIRKCVITKHNTLYFYESPTSIMIFRVYDVRQNPKKLKF